MAASSTFRLRDHRMDSSCVKQVFRQGKKMNLPGYCLRVFYPEKKNESRVGFLISKKVGSAVLRNKLRRILRKAFQDSCESFSNPLWVLFEFPKLAFTGSVRSLRNPALTTLFANGKN